MVYCSKCGIKNEEDAVYCEKCGNQIVRKVYPRNNVSIEKTCPSCGFINKENRDYCQKCQKSLKESVKEHTSPKNTAIKNDKPFNITPLIWGILGGLILLFLNYYLLGVTFRYFILSLEMFLIYSDFFYWMGLYPFIIFFIPFIGGLIPCLLVDGRLKTGIKYGIFSSAVLYILAVLLEELLYIILIGSSVSIIIRILFNDLIYYIFLFIIWILLGIGGGIIGVYIKKLLNK